MGSGASCMQRQPSPKPSQSSKALFDTDPKPDSLKSTEAKSVKQDEEILSNIVTSPSSSKPITVDTNTAGSAGSTGSTATTDTNDSGNKIALATKEQTPNSQATSDTTTTISDSGSAGVTTTVTTTTTNNATSTTSATSANVAVTDQSQQPSNESNESNAGSEVVANNGNENNADDAAANGQNGQNGQNSENASSSNENDKNDSNDSNDIESEYKHDPEQEKLYQTSMMDLKDLNHYAPISGLAERTVYKQHAKKSEDGGANKSNFKKVIKEIQTSLPDNITISWNGSMFIRYDEDMPQFLQCILTGLIDTPYENGIFLFDIYLDNTYPNNAPKIQHTTKGATLVTANNGPGGFSPNLHKSTGKVCLSLLGTWNEGATWDAGKSNVYQVLSTILFMIFGSKYPYYMEPGYGGWEGDAPQSDHQQDVIEYNEELYWGTLKYGILDVLKTPYKGFEQVIKNHFKLKKDEILNCIENKWIKKGSKPLKDKLNPLLLELKQEFEKLESSSSDTVEPTTQPDRDANVADATKEDIVQTEKTEKPTDKVEIDKE